ncbi:endoplasmic reticulum mannosyl-oligosaccharide 1,2-alpha-mannosidase-like [Ptychodera flava]|uniref:endoplasmic reticulum mannosyl-oligosaccharide 1,2-alpha-mannosidase-like n=1 Tax=Ptychodera flava TaxID=63121 RepID=UPI00396A98AB
MYNQFQKRDFISFTVADDRQYNNSKGLRRQSCRRMWNRLSRLQRSIIFLILSLGAFSGFYILPGIYAKHRHLEGEQAFFSRNKISGNDDGEAVIDQPINIQDLREKAAKQVQEIVDRRKPGKRGPPGLRKGDGDPNVQEMQQKPPVDIENAENGEDERYEEEEDVKPKYGPQNERQQAVVNAFKHAWKGYKQYAWGHDELKPVSKRHSEWFRLGLTLVDGLDTMYIMGLHEEFQEARDWVANKMDVNPNVDVNLFETTIRVLGGLLSTFHLSGDNVFLEKAVKLGDALLPCFNSNSKVPYSDVNLKTHRAHAPKWGPDSTVSEVSTIQLEFRDLTFTTGDPKYKTAVDTVMDHLLTLPKKDHLVPIFINANTGQFRQGSTITLGARGDSYYEYLLKQWVQTGQSELRLKDEYVNAIEGVRKHLVRESVPSGLTYVGELVSGNNISPKMDHLVCFLPGTLALGYVNGLSESHLELSESLLYTCYQMYASMPTFLSPEIVYFNTMTHGREDITVKSADTHNLLRPETIESLFYLYRVTLDNRYREWGWSIFQAFERYTKIEGGGYSSIDNVKNVNHPGFKDKMESFFLGETLKYFYLLFSDDLDLLSLDKYVFNTEGHPLPIRERTK